MSAPTYLTINTDGTDLEVKAAQTSAANAIVSTSANGLIDGSFLPAEMTLNIPASESLLAGAMVNVYSNAGALNARNADNSNGRRAHGFTIAAVSSLATATVVMYQGSNTGVSSLTVGSTYMLGTAGAVTTVLPTGTGVLVQLLGIATTATQLNVHITDEIVTRA